MCTGTTNPQQVQCSVEKVQKYETPKEKHSGWNIESHLSTFWPSTSVPIRLIASLNNVSNLPESIYRQRLPAQLSKTSFLNLSFLSGFSRRFTGDISEVFTQHPPKISHKKVTFHLSSFSAKAPMADHFISLLRPQRSTKKRPGIVAKMLTTPGGSQKEQNGWKKRLVGGTDSTPWKHVKIKLDHFPK